MHIHIHIHIHEHSMQEQSRDSGVSAGGSRSSNADELAALQEQVTKLNGDLESEREYVSQMDAEVSFCVGGVSFECVCKLVVCMYTYTHTQTYTHTHTHTEPAKGRTTEGAAARPGCL